MKACGIAKVIVLIVVTAFVLAGQVGAAQDRDQLFQISTIDALMAGLYDGTMSTGELTRRGDFGLGTFDKLDGEMIVLDGTVYQITSDGLAHTTSAALTSPFAAVTFFDRDLSTVVATDSTLAALQKCLDEMLPSKNLFYAIRVDGQFAQVTTRSVPKQSAPYRPLVQVVAEQSVTRLQDVRGTIVGFRCPYFVQGVNVPGYHLHFITADRRRGGHLLDCTIKSGSAVVDITPGFVLSLPQDEGFYHKDFQSNQKDLEKVEGK